MCKAGLDDAGRRLTPNFLNMPAIPSSGNTNPVALCQIPSLRGTKSRQEISDAETPGVQRERHRADI